jgi:hypothetical protein
MSQELYYDRGLKKWRSFDSETGEVGGIVRENDPYFIVNIEGYRKLCGMLGLGGLGFFGILVSFMEYKNRVALSYRKITKDYGISSATIKRYMDLLKQYNIIIEQVSERGRKYYLVNGEYAFRGSRSQMAENAKIFKENAYQINKSRVDKK